MNIKEFNPFEDVLVCPECGNDDFVCTNLSETKHVIEGVCSRCKMRLLSEEYGEWTRIPGSANKNTKVKGVKVNDYDNRWGILLCEGKEPKWRWRELGMPSKYKKVPRANKEIQERWVAHLVAEKMMESL